jgi:hypothetical protein
MIEIILQEISCHMDQLDGKRRRKKKREREFKYTIQYTETETTVNIVASPSYLMK